MTVDWGDGSPRESHATGLSHTYAAGSGRKLVKFFCPDWEKLTSFDINSDLGRLTLPDFSLCTKLVTLYINSNQFSGQLPNFSVCTELTSIGVYTNLLSGTLPNFAPCIKLAYFGFSNNQFSGYVPGSLATQKSIATLNLGVNNLPEASVDAVLADCVTSLGIPGRVVCTLSLNGAGNSPPSAAGIANHLTLEAAGWTVNIN